MLLITGASGSVGSAVLAAAAKTGAKHRALFRRPPAAGDLPAGTEVVLGDFAEPAGLAGALSGVDSVFLVCAPIPDLVHLEINMIEACKAAGVRKIVLNSALGAGRYQKSFPALHRQVENHLLGSGIAYCILRPDTFMQNMVAYFAPGIRAEGKFYAAMGEAPVHFIDVRDIAEVAVQALTTEKHDQHIYELHGPDGLTYGEVADRISLLTGVEAGFVDIPREAQQRAMQGAGMPDWQITAILDLQEYYTGSDKATPTDLTRQILGRKPRTVDGFIAENTGSFRSAEPGAPDAVNPKTGMTAHEAGAFIRDHFEEFVNRKNLEIGRRNFAPDFVDHGADVPPGTPAGPEGAIQYVGNALKRYPDMKVAIEDLIAEDDKVVVRNLWTATDPSNGNRIGFRGIVIWRIKDRRIVERWAYLEAPHPIG
jgi:uncharacterized protein YbjT (DUF2867 family)/predicted SnoaL-like aldol condensation-catalyzing enzyme